VRDLYPAIEPYDSGLLDVGDGQSVYWETVGSPTGTPAVFLHGGPGGGCSPGHRRNFDPASYRAVLFDQRGCGRSTPSAADPHTDLSVNTTDHLVADIERLREHLGIERWVVVGVSWGVTLALVYAQRHPERVRAMVLTAVTAGTQREIDWITRDVGRIFPQEWERFAAVVDAGPETNLPAAYARLLADPDPTVRAGAAHEWCVWEDTHVSLTPEWTPRLQQSAPEFKFVFARLVTHYWGNRCFLADDEVPRNMACLVGVPAVLIHGRRDVSGPLDTAWRLHRSWPDSRLVVLDDAGHGGPSMGAAMIEACDMFRSAG
jgi:proline iminopeptidase